MFMFEVVRSCGCTIKCVSGTKIEKFNDLNKCVELTLAFFIGDTKCTTKSCQCCPYL